MLGDPYQFFLNTPFGENLENQLAYNYKSFSSRFRFNAKEWDEETGNFYYGARYYDPKVSVWLSVDPLAHKLPNYTPFCFSNNSPVNMVDPDGRMPQAVVGFMIGFALDVTAQMIFEGKDLVDVDYMSAAVSGGAGALSGGVSSVAKFGKYGSRVASASIDVAESLTKQVLDPKLDGEITLEKTLSDAVAGAIGNKVKVVDNAKIKVKENKLDRAQRIANGSNSPSKARKVSEAKGELNNSNMKNEAAGRATGNTLQNVSDGVRSLFEGPTIIPANLNPSLNTNAVQDNTSFDIVVDPNAL